jgi:hypothetical protein
MENAGNSEDIKSLGYWSSDLSSTCSNAINELSSIQVSPELQPAKNMLLSSLSDIKKGGDDIATAAKYHEEGQISLSTNYLDQGNKYLVRGTEKLEAGRQLLD